MFNRSLKVSVVKDKGQMPSNQNDAGFEDKVTVVSAVVDKSIKKIALGVCAYVLLDTIRQVAVKSASK